MGTATAMLELGVEKVSDAPDDLVFQSVKDGKPIRDNDVLIRFNQAVSA
jgi:hypothetical protein